MFFDCSAPYPPLFFSPIRLTFYLLRARTHTHMRTHIKAV